MELLAGAAVIERADSEMSPTELTCTETWPVADDDGSSFCKEDVTTRTLRFGIDSGGSSRLESDALARGGVEASDGFAEIVGVACFALSGIQSEIVPSDEIPLPG